jgi:sec-independent protein translocase protein TatA
MQSRSAEPVPWEVQSFDRKELPMFGGSIGWPEVLIVLALALLILGPKKLPEVGRSLGRGMREFKDSISGATIHDDDDDDEVRTLKASEQSK